MHRLSASFVLAYHGCDQTVAELLLSGKAFRRSDNAWEWLGDGIYFWEANPKRGLEWATEITSRPASKIVTPAVVGAVIDLRYCLDLTTSAGISQVQDAYQTLHSLLETAGELESIPKNDKVRKRHNLDCAVINTLHATRQEQDLHPFDTIKGAFLEGTDAYPDSAFNTKTHIQICVRNADCIRGVFRVPGKDLE